MVPSRWDTAASASERESVEVNTLVVPSSGVGAPVVTATNVDASVAPRWSDAPVVPALAMDAPVAPTPGVDTRGAPAMDAAVEFVSGDASLAPAPEVNALVVPSTGVDAPVVPAPDVDASVARITGSS